MDVHRLLAERRSALIEKYRRERDAAALPAASSAYEDDDERENFDFMQQVNAKPTPTTSLYSTLKPAKKRKKFEDVPPTKQNSEELFVTPVSADDRPARRLKQSTSTEKTSGISYVKDEPCDDKVDDKVDAKYEFGPAPKPSRKGQKKAGYKTVETVETRTAAHTSQWYTSISTRKEQPRGQVIAVGYIKNLIQNCITTVRNNENPETSFANLRIRLHEMEFFNWLTDDSGPIIKKSGVLEKGGLVTIFDDPDHLFPWDIEADALALYRRWMSGDLDGHLLRGISTMKGTLTSGMARTSHKIRKDYPRRVTANVSGHNNLVNGRWWPNRICALRDGAHGEQEAGISGQTGHGAYSVVVAAGGYSDEDNGLTIEYCGTASKTYGPTKNTSLMLETLRLKTPLRVLRAENKSSPFAPSRGIRYDGLYDVVGKELLDEPTAMYRFSLRRQKDQDPIRYEGVEARPSEQEVNEMMKIRKNLGMA